MRDSKKPLIVSVSGAPYSGVTTALGRVARCLTSQGITTSVVELNTRYEVLRFEDDYVMNRYNAVDVVLFDKHRNTESAAKQRRIKSLWEEDSVVPDLSVLMSCKLKSYKQYIAQRPKSINMTHRHESYIGLSDEHHGTLNHCVVPTDGKLGRLYAAGIIKTLILQELK